MTTTPTRKTKLMTTADLAELVGVEPRTIERWRENRVRVDAGEKVDEVGEIGPVFMPFGRTIRYHPARVQAWMLAREQGTPTRKQAGGRRGR